MSASSADIPNAGYCNDGTLLRPLLLRTRLMLKLLLERLMPLLLGVIELLACYSQTYTLTSAVAKQHVSGLCMQFAARFDGHGVKLSMLSLDVTGLSACTVTAPTAGCWLLLT